MTITGSHRISRLEIMENPFFLQFMLPPFMAPVTELLAPFAYRQFFIVG
jgi:hypothetical protein